MVIRENHQKAVQRPATEHYSGEGGIPTSSECTSVPIPNDSNMVGVWAVLHTPASNFPDTSLVSYKSAQFQYYLLRDRIILLRLRVQS